MQEYLRRHTNPPVFLISGAVILLFLLFGIVFTDQMSVATGAVTGFITTYFGWFYILSATAFLIFVVSLLFTRFGKIRLGPDDSRPEFSTFAWFAMLFTAGMGIGLVFYGVAEPIVHFTGPPVGEGGTEAAADAAMNYTFYHWLLHPWAVYIVFGLALAYAGFRRGLPFRPASIFQPILGDRVNGPIGHTIDIVAVFGTIFGLATSLGLGAQQINAGLGAVAGIGQGTGIQIILIAIITVIAAISVLFGIDKGIRRLSEINMVLAVVLVAAVFLLGPTLFILSSLGENIGYYFQNLVGTSFNMFTGNETGQEWMSAWTLFYWGWWISWSPFVGMFIARISRGRTIREFVAGALLAPAGASAVWFTVFGSTALNLIMTGNGGGLAEASTESAMFVLFDQLNLGAVFTVILSIVTIVVVVLFFATSSDSGSLVVDILTNGGDPNPVWYQRLFWAILEGAVAAVLLLVGGAAALTSLQAASIAAGLPLCLVLIGMCFALIKAFQQDAVIMAENEAPDPGRAMSRPRGTVSPQQMSAEKFSSHDDDRNPGGDR
ncbi:MAG: BCCT family transporter [Rubrobacteraceae bacterium]